MNKQTFINVMEKEIEDVLATYPELLKDILSLECELNLVTRQMKVPSGRIDLLFIGGNKLYLVELKVEKFHRDFIRQVSAYESDLRNLQDENKIIKAYIETYLLLPNCESDDIQFAKDRNVIIKTYSPESLLETFFKKFSSISNFLTVRPMDYGIWNIHLINRVIYSLPGVNTIEQLASSINISKNSIRNQLRLAEQLGLVSRIEGKYFLSDRGQQYFRSRIPDLSESVLSENQINVIRDFIIKDPFFSPTIFGIYSIVESVFILARNTYPVKIDDLIDFYRSSVGKKFEWKTTRSAFLGTRAFRNFAVELGLVAVVGDKVLLTPSGFRFILLLQLHKGLRLIDSLK